MEKDNIETLLAKHRATRHVPNPQTIRTMRCKAMQDARKPSMHASLFHAFECESSAAPTTPQNLHLKRQWHAPEPSSSPSSYVASTVQPQRPICDADNSKTYALQQHYCSSIQYPQMPSHRDHPPFGKCFYHKKGKTSSLPTPRND